MPLVPPAMLHGGTNKNRLPFEYSREHKGNANKVASRAIETSSSVSNPLVDF